VSEGQQISPLSPKPPREGDGTQIAAFFLGTCSPAMGSELFLSHIASQRSGTEGKRKE